MARKDKPAPTEGQFDRTVGEVPKTYDFFEVSARSMGLAQRLVPILARLIMLMSIVSILAMGISLVSVYRRHNPQVLLSFPDGATRCAMPPLDPATRQPKPRPDWEEDVCQQLAHTTLDETTPETPR